MTAVQELIVKIKKRIPFFQYSVYQDDFDAAIEKEKQQIIRSYKDHHDLGHIYGLDGEYYYQETYNNKNREKAEKIINYMQLCNNDPKKSSLFAIELMIEVCNSCLLYTKQPVKENDDIYNNLVKVKNELKKITDEKDGLYNQSFQKSEKEIENWNIIESLKEKYI